MIVIKARNTDKVRRTIGRHRPVATRRARSLVVLLAACVVGSVIPPSTATAASGDVRSKQWYLDALSAEEMWRKTTGSGIKVAVIDSGVNASTPSLKGQVLDGADLTDGAEGATVDRSGQGTTTAELIAGTGKGGGIKGLAPGAKIIPIRLPLLRHDEVPQIDDPLAAAIRKAVDSDARIINISIGSEFAIGKTGYLGFLEESVLEYAMSKGKLLIAGVGDNASEGNKAQYPASYPEVVGVGAADRDATATDDSQHGDVVDIAAPGVDLPRWCDATFDKYCFDGAGSVSATALTSASAALIWSMHPDWTATQVTRVLFDTAGRDWERGTLSSYLGHGILRPAKHVLKGSGSPGAPDPGLAPDDIELVAMPPSSTPVPSDDTAAPTPEAVAAPPVATAPADAAKPGTNGGPPMLPIVAGSVVALALVGGSVAFARRRRRPPV